ncbi:soluble guanylate cyclase 89Db [Hyalella azteca]|uniref:guanylate cyclase n=1 Tax=Hyalella azteca TaxID=294128 RepID=A0A979FVF1_HYAAZ|nr:soluble guanylate cyclase 89Db [Hyalella azteca]
MYGMLLLSACQFGQAEYGDTLWSKVLEFAGVKNTVFDPHVRYPDHIFTQLAEACTVLIGEGDQEDYMVFFGRCFVRYCSSYGYDKVLRRAGRHFCHFLQEVDNLHAQLRFSFHKMRSPSLIVTRFDGEGAVLQYRSCRVGFTHYVIVAVVAGAEDVGAEDVGAEDVGAEDVGAEDVGAGDVGAEDVGAEDVGAGDVGAEDVGAEDVGAGDVGAEDVGAEDVGAGDVGAEDVGAEDVGAGDVGAEDVGAEDVGAGDVGAEDVGAEDVGAGDVGAEDVGAEDVGAGDVGAEDVGAEDVGAGDVGAEDVGAEDVGAAAAWHINCVSYRLDFDNRDFLQDFQKMKVDFSRPSLPNTTLHVIMQLFPCGIVMDADLRVRLAGDRIHQLLGAGLIGSEFVDHFSIRRPVMQFSWKEVLMHDRVAWEVVARIKANNNNSSHTSGTSPLSTPTPPDGVHGGMSSSRASLAPGYSCNPKPPTSGFTGGFAGASSKSVGSLSAMACPFSAELSGQRAELDASQVSLERRRSHRSEWIQKNRSLSSDQQLHEGEKGLLLKGQMYILKDHQMAMFLCMPLINNQQEMRDLGLYLNDLSMHDLSREMALTDWQHCSNIELMYNRAEENSAKLEETLNLREQWKERGDNLLYAMLPRQVADLLRQGQHPLETCQSFEEVSVLFAEASLLEERKSLEALEIVRSVNEMYNLLDDLTDRYSVFKVETVGGVYMVVGGVPEPLADHTAHVAALALHMTRAVNDNFRRTHNIRIGIHVGPVVAGVVGNRLPRYCLFGDTVNTASRMLTNCHFGRVHVTERYAKAVEALGFRTRHRGTLPIKGKGTMSTYWLEGYQDENVAHKRSDDNSSHARV